MDLWVDIFVDGRVSLRLLGGCTERRTDQAIN